MEVQQAIAARRSIRAFSDRPVPGDAIEQMLNAGRLAPSGCNAQPWRFVAVHEPAVIQALGRRKAFRQKFVSGAPLIVVCCGDPAAYKGKYGGEGQVEEGSVPADEGARREMFSTVEGREVLRTVRDVSIAAAFMVLRATELGLGTCFVGLIDEGVLREVLGLPAGLVVPFVVAAGYPARVPPPTPRKSLHQIQS
jgi:nitroreductase